YLLASPFILGLLIFVAFPMGYSVWLVLHSWDLLSPPEFIGLENISRMLKDPQLEISLANTAFYSFLGVPLHLAVAFALAMLLDQPLRGRDLFRTGFYLPSITPAVATAVLWARIFHPEFGILNEVIGWFGVPPQKWLFEPELAKPAFILMGFSHIGPQMVIFLAGLQSVPATLMEAAGIDGASAWQRFRHITIPMISPVILFNLVVGIIGSFQVFTSALIMTNGGPQNATLFAVLYIYRNGFQYFKMGYAASLAWLLFTIIVSFTVVQFLLSRHWVYYEESR
ncbi:MAG: sugar ABC transporter permease, partial [Chloroflexi bacterium]|nr:sugar ABC transporter permease [Chloroflexota bacterium]